MREEVIKATKLTEQKLDEGTIKDGHSRKMKIWEEVINNDIYTF